MTDAGISAPVVGMNFPDNFARKMHRVFTTATGAEFVTEKITRPDGSEFEVTRQVPDLLAILRACMVPWWRAVWRMLTLRGEG